jgi:membrane protease YdiL (CAAX protease family)
MFTGKAATSLLTSTYGCLSMCTPALANILTRLITREGMKDSYLSLNLQGGKWKYYLLAFILPLCYMIISLLLILVLYCGSAKNWFTTEDVPMKFWMYIGQIGTTLLLFLPFLGEEFGWRAYMTPKLEQLLPMPCALVTGGFLWGLWHAPLTIQGHNFGKDYPGFPILGILIMCIMCTAMGAILTFLTKRTQSVIPAAIMHGINNNMSFMIVLSLFGSEEVLKIYSKLNTFTGFTLMLIPICIIGSICFFILCKEAKTNNNTIKLT